MTTAFALDEAAIEARVGASSFQRGRTYFRNGAISGARRTGNTLRARCQGTQDRPYRVEATVGAKGIEAAACSCPVGEGGYCKHVAALLLTWTRQPEVFVEAEEIDSGLTRRSKEELIALVKLLLRRAPELEDLLELPLPAAGAAADAVDPEIYRRQARAAFRHAGDAWGAEWGIAAELATIVEVGDGFAGQGAWANAATVYAAVADAVIEGFEEYSDENGDLIGTGQNCAERLGRCLEALHDAEARRPVVEALFALYAGDMELGGIEIAGEAPALLVSKTTPEERRWLAGRIREIMPAAAGSMQNWAREAWGALLLDLEAEDMDDEGYLAICRETGRTGDLVERLLKLGRVDEADEEAESSNDYELPALADRFVAHGEGERAERLVRERSGRSTDLRLNEWLRDCYKAQGDTNAALEMALRIYRARPELHSYRVVRELAVTLGRFEALRPELQRIATNTAAASLAIQIFLEEGQIDQALAALRAASDRWMHSSMALTVAKAAEASRPADALAIYAQHAEQLIEQRGRENYIGACSLLLRVRELYGRLDQAESWQRSIADLRQRHRSLPALREELDNAGL